MASVNPITQSARAKTATVIEDKSRKLNNSHC